jgi:hypothetical protein
MTGLRNISEFHISGMLDLVYAHWTEMATILNIKRWHCHLVHVALNKKVCGLLFAPLSSRST